MFGPGKFIPTAGGGGRVEAAGGAIAAGRVVAEAILEKASMSARMSSDFKAAPSLGSDLIGCDAVEELEGTEAAAGACNEPPPVNTQVIASLSAARV